MDDIERIRQSLTEMPYRYAVFTSDYKVNREMRFVALRHINVFYVVREECKTVEIRKILNQRQLVRTDD